MVQKKGGDIIVGDGVVLYGWGYIISIAAWFEVAGETSNAPTKAILKALAVTGYESSMLYVKEARSRDWPTVELASGAQSWKMTRLGTAKCPIRQDHDHLRENFGSGGFGTVCTVIDKVSGNAFAIKVANIVEYLGNQLFHTSKPRVI
ncbi:hypothetical protein B0T26DRAFT_783022 [Lasiosphaeria miniovina]|uniref:Protein kinase domain-containing protein n=1 Tax=Lasiosphaeria miniovina TaxID=1954250 RepID=A0AA40DUB7_9PEZI|nr:uncharacterized protein B0T26DRAFT_783022 [Lasiosphaeria miniovina]KAK0713662.1 hypothetical protein B0T26DRAFT_783022 [Lasiosphaeria miniovina]